MPTVDEAVDGWIRHFAASDRELQWLAAEEELSIPLVPGVILAGRIDARLRTPTGNAFGEWKTMSKFAKSGWREKWRFHPQSLTYGLLLRETHPEIDRFTIRVCFKTDPPTYDYEWFGYSAGELDTWRAEVERIAHEILSYTHSLAGAHEHWSLNPLSCYKFGPKYPCPYVHACSHGEWNIPQPTAPAVYTPHLQVMLDARAQSPAPLVLDATAITQYLECPEAFRRRYIRGEDELPSEALQFGGKFHQMLDLYYQHHVKGIPFDVTGASSWPNQNQNVSPAM